MAFTFLIATAATLSAVHSAELRAIPPSELAAHANKGDFWIAVHGKVYDVTDWLAKHPGGPSIMKKYAGKVADKGFDGVHRHKDPLEHIPASKLLGALDVSTANEQTSRQSNFRRLDQEKEEDLLPFAKKALAHVRAHPIVRDNPYLNWFSKGQASAAQLRALTVQFSVFSNLFLEAQLLKILNAPSLAEMREGKEILVNELGVIFNPKLPEFDSAATQAAGRTETAQKAALQEAELSGNSEFDPSLVSTDGSVEGGKYSHQAAHFEWMLDVGKVMGLDFSDMGKRRHGTNSTLHFTDSLRTIYGSDDLSVSLGASFAIEHWANAGFWDDLVDGFSKVSKETFGKHVPNGYWLFHQHVEGAHQEHTMDELLVALEMGRITDEAAFLDAATRMLDANAVFWDGLNRMRLSLA